jgi:hypothetical protein
MGGRSVITLSAVSNFGEKREMSMDHFFSPAESKAKPPRAEQGDVQTNQEGVAKRKEILFGEH